MTGFGRLLHRAWSLLPRRPRRWAFILASTLRAPRPQQPPPPARPPVVVAGVFRSASGLGESARLQLAALTSADVPCAIADLSPSLLGSDELPLAASVPPVQPGPGSLILHVSGPFVPYALGWLGRPIVAEKRVIGFWHWELPRLPREWRVGCRYVHEVWVPSRFVAEAVAADFAGPVRVVPHPISLPEGVDPAPLRRRFGGAFLAVAMFNMASGFERKNPLAAVAAFRRAFDRDMGARLVVKMLNGQVWPDGERALRAAIADAPNIELVTDTMSRVEVFSLLAAADVALSLHRAEGFGLLAAEAMLLGTPVVATDWSATTDFVNAANACPVPCRLVPAIDPQGSYHDPNQRWADPDIDAAAQWLRRLREDHALAERLGRTARATAIEMFGLENYSLRTRTILGF